MAGQAVRAVRKLIDGSHFLQQLLIENFVSMNQHHGASMHGQLQLKSIPFYPPGLFLSPYDFLCYLFFISRLVSSSRQTDVIVFNVRCGTSEGVSTHHLRTETHRDLAGWARALVQGAHQAVFKQRELICRKLRL